MTTLIGKGFKTVNYGKLFEHFFEVCQELTTLGYDVHFKFPRFYSETKFANYVRLVYTSFREDYPGLVRTFSEVVEKLKLGSSQDKTKSKEISGLLGKLFNLKFVLQLSGSCGSILGSLGSLLGHCAPVGCTERPRGPQS